MNSFRWWIWCKKENFNNKKQNYMYKFSPHQLKSSKNNLICFPKIYSLIYDLQEYLLLNKTVWLQNKKNIFQIACLILQSNILYRMILSAYSYMTVLLSAIFSFIYLCIWFTVEYNRKRIIKIEPRKKKHIIDHQRWIHSYCFNEEGK